MEVFLMAEKPFFASFCNYCFHVCRRFFERWVLNSLMVILNSTTVWFNQYNKLFWFGGMQKCTGIFALNCCSFIGVCDLIVVDHLNNTTPVTNKHKKHWQLKKTWKKSIKKKNSLLSTRMQCNIHCNITVHGVLNIKEIISSIVVLHYRYLTWLEL